MGRKGVNVAARPPEGSPDKAGGFSASSLPLISTLHPVRMSDDPAKKPGIGVWVFEKYITTEVFNIGAVGTEERRDTRYHAVLGVCTRVGVTAPGLEVGKSLNIQNSLMSKASIISEEKTRA